MNHQKFKFVALVWLSTFSLAAHAFGILAVSSLGGPSPAAPAIQGGSIPIGTVLPISFEHELSSKDMSKGEAVEGRVMQDVPLPNKQKIPSGAKIFGTILNVVPAGTDPASITFRLNTLEFHHQTIPVVTALRTMAPFEDVQSAHNSFQDTVAVNSAGWATTVQIGGDIRYGDGGKVTNRHHKTIGKGTADGVLVHLADQPGSPCAGWPDGPERLQALWVFSADSCGLYDLNHMKISHAGNADPLGEITLTKEKEEGDIKIMKSSAMLLRVVH